VFASGSAAFDFTDAFTNSAGPYCGEISYSLTKPASPALDNVLFIDVMEVKIRSELLTDAANVHVPSPATH